MEFSIFPRLITELSPTLVLGPITTPELILQFSPIITGPEIVTFFSIIEFFPVNTFPEIFTLSDISPWEYSHPDTEHGSFGQGRYGFSSVHRGQRGVLSQSDGGHDGPFSCPIQY